MRPLVVAAALTLAVSAASRSPGLPAASRSAATIAACLASALADTLTPVRFTETRARAYWLSRSIMQWPGAPADGRYALYRSAAATLRLAPGDPVTGADARIALRTYGGALAPKIASRFRFLAAGARLQLPSAFDVGRVFREQAVLVREDDEGRVIDATYVQLAGALDDRHEAAVSAPDLGARVNRRDARLAVWAPTAQRVSTCLYPDARTDSATLVPMTRDAATGIWRASISGNRRGAGYLYLVDVFVPGVGVVRNRVTDPWGVALTANSRRSVLLSLDDPDAKPDGWDRARRPPPLAAATDLVAYELHVRDFSATDTTVRPAWRGKYLAFTEHTSSGMSSLRALGQAGVTDVHLLPAYDLSTVPEVGCVTPTVPGASPESEQQQSAVSALRDRDCQNWGYDPFHYTVPEGSYSTNAAVAAQRIREFRAMVQALHASGLRVGMDVVYNHTFASGQAPKSVLDRIVPGYYHRLNADGQVERSTCCENTATEHAMMAKLMIESAATWARDYRIDSFRFDLMGHQPRAAMERLQRAVDAAARRHIPLIGEGWDFGEVAGGARFQQASQRELGGTGIGTFSDRARDALRGGGCCDGGEALVANQGLLNGLHYAPNAANTGRDRSTELQHASDLAKVGLAGTLRDDANRTPVRYGDQPAGYAREPGEVVNYIENHDNLTLFDLNALRLPRGTSRDERARRQLLGIAFVTLSQGIAYLHAGVEIMRSKSLDRDSYDSGDWFNRVDWTGRTNFFGSGLPPAHRNQADWPVMRPVLADTSIAPTPADIGWVRMATLDLLAVRRSSTLFRLRTAADIRRRLRFVGADPTLIVGHIDGQGYPGGVFGEVLYAINVSNDTKQLTAPELAGAPWVQHPVMRAPHATDLRLQEARLSNGMLTMPPTTVAVFVRARTRN